jgi:DNA polymerase/3'-5' exonuclease PolX
MSSGPRHTREAGAMALELIAGELGETISAEPESGRLFALGSYRRGRETIGDLEIALPYIEPEQDRHAIKLLERFTPEGAGMFAGGSLGVRLMGVSPGFRHARVRLDLPAGSIPIEIFRYDAGDLGNAGWLAMLRTGPSELASIMLGRFAAQYGARSEGNYPRTRSGEPIPCPTEREAFRLCRTTYTPPDQRQRLLNVLRGARQGVAS